MTKAILTYPNKKLKEVSSEVITFNIQLHQLLDDMFDTMIQKGIGLAAIQIGIAQRVLIINLPNEDGIQEREKTLEIINPILLKQEGKTICQEGCLSVPKFYADVKRFKCIEIKYQDRFGQDHQISSEDFLAIAIQHEIDHLDGKLFVDKLGVLKRKKFEKEWIKLQKEA